MNNTWLTRTVTLANSKINVRAIIQQYSNKHHNGEHYSQCRSWLDKHDNDIDDNNNTSNNFNNKLNHKSTSLITAIYGISKSFDTQEPENRA